MARKQKAARYALYHLTDPANVEAILREGIRGDEEGMVFTITDLFVAPDVALYQLFLKEYAVFGITGNGIAGAKIGPDEVGELTRGYHRIVYRKVIPPDAIAFLGIHKADPEKTTEFQYLWNERLFGKTREEQDRENKLRLELLARYQAGEITLDEVNEAMAARPAN